MSDNRKDLISAEQIVGLVPAAGSASRLSPLPCSKEVYPVGFQDTECGSSFRPKVISQYLLETMRKAGIRKAYIILRDGKWDIPSYYGDGGIIDMSIAYLMMNLPYGVPYTLDQAFPFIKNSIVALGFPDMIFEPEDAFVSLLDRFQKTEADLVLGLFPALRPHKTDMMEVDDNGKIRSIQIKPRETNLKYAWEIAVWTPVFTEFMHNYLVSKDGNDGNPKSSGSELQISEIVQAAIEADLKIESVIFEKGTCLDIGTPEDLLKSLKHSCRISLSDNE